MLEGNVIKIVHIVKWQLLQHYIIYIPTKAFALIKPLVWIILALEVRIESDSGRRFLNFSWIREVATTVLRRRKPVLFCFEENWCNTVLRRRKPVLYCSVFSGEC